METVVPLTSIHSVFGSARSPKTLPSKSTSKSPTKALQKLRRWLKIFTNGIRLLKDRIFIESHSKCSRFDKSTPWALVICRHHVLATRNITKIGKWNKLNAVYTVSSIEVIFHMGESKPWEGFLSSAAVEIS